MMGIRTNKEFIGVWVIASIVFYAIGESAGLMAFAASVIVGLVATLLLS